MVGDGGGGRVSCRRRRRRRSLSSVVVDDGGERSLQTKKVFRETVRCGPTHNDVVLASLCNCKAVSFFEQKRITSDNAYFFQVLDGPSAPYLDDATRTIFFFRMFVFRYIFFRFFASF
jgi:hypothetical protein